jgi:imidazolonepropionase-like amidohydrolase
VRSSDVLFILAACWACGAPRAHAEAGASSTTAFVHVNVVPMDRDRVLRDQTVVVADGRIVSVGSEASIPKDAKIVDGHGTAWLSPGLADMHTHSESKQDLAVYLSQGVTTVLQMGGARASFVDKTVPAVNRGAIPGPHVYASFLVDGNTDYNGFVIRTPAQARAIVGIAKTNGYDFIKVYVGLAPDVFDALADEGRIQGMPLVGHGVTAVRLERQLAEGQVLVAHAEEFFYTFFTPAGVEETDTPPPENRIPEAVALAKKYGATATADLATYAAIAHQIQHPAFVASLLAKPEAALLSPNDRMAWQASGYFAKTAKLEAKLAFLGKMVKAMADGGVELVAGTDAPAVPGMLPGFSLHDDLDALEGAGLTRFQVLTSATRAPGAFIARTKGGEPFGVVAPGYRADLVLTAGNPLESLATLRTPLGVMARGEWRDGAALKALSDGVAEAYRRAAAP